MNVIVLIKGPKFYSWMCIINKYWTNVLINVFKIKCKMCKWFLHIICFAISYLDLFGTFVLRGEGCRFHWNETFIHFIYWNHYKKKLYFERFQYSDLDKSTVVFFIVVIFMERSSRTQIIVKAAIMKFICEEITIQQFSWI